MAPWAAASVDMRVKMVVPTRGSLLCIILRSGYGGELACSMETTVSVPGSCR